VQARAACGTALVGLLGQPVAHVDHTNDHTLPRGCLVGGAGWAVNSNHRMYPCMGATNRTGALLVADRGGAVPWFLPGNRDSENLIPPGVRVVPSDSPCDEVDWVSIGERTCIGQTSAMQAIIGTRVGGASECERAEYLSPNQILIACTQALAEFGLPLKGTPIAVQVEPNILAPACHRTSDGTIVTPRRTGNFATYTPHATFGPTRGPTATPTHIPTQGPSGAPTMSPSTMAPTRNPSCCKAKGGKCSITNRLSSLSGMKCDLPQYTSFCGYYQYLEGTVVGALDCEYYEADDDMLTPNSAPVPTTQPTYDSEAAAYAFYSANGGVCDEFSVQVGMATCITAQGEWVPQNEATKSCAIGGTAVGSQWLVALCLQVAERRGKAFSLPSARFFPFPKTAACLLEGDRYEIATPLAGDNGLAVCVRQKVARAPAINALRATVAGRTLDVCRASAGVGGLVEAPGTGEFASSVFFTPTADRCPTGTRVVGAICKSAADAFRLPYREGVHLDGGEPCGLTQDGLFASVGGTMAAPARSGQHFVEILAVGIAPQQASALGLSLLLPRGALSHEDKTKGAHAKYTATQSGNSSGGSHGAAQSTRALLWYHPEGRFPTRHPTYAPTGRPTNAPTKAPTPPTKTPTNAPTNAPTTAPTMAPSPTESTKCCCKGRGGVCVGGQCSVRHLYPGWDRVQFSLGEGEQVPYKSSQAWLDWFCSHILPCSFYWSDHKDPKKRISMDHRTPGPTSAAPTSAAAPAPAAAPTPAIEWSSCDHWCGFG